MGQQKATGMIGDGQIQDSGSIYEILSRLKKE